ncbi:MAG: hypothetical protein RL077_97 [Verrucomicrobiota bacterium]
MAVAMASRMKPSVRKTIDGERSNQPSAQLIGGARSLLPRLPAIRNVGERWTASVEIIS